MIKHLLWIKIGLCFLSFICIERLCHLATDGFSLQRIRPLFSISEKYYPKLPSSSIKDILSQDFTYLASGSQSFAFISKDKQYVLKFFKLRPSLWQLYKFSRIEHVAKRTFDSCLINKANFKRESALLYCHLAPSSYSLPSVKLYCRSGAVFKQNLAQVPFVLQRFAEPTKKRLMRLKELGYRREQERVIDSLLALMLKRYRLGYSDKDPNWVENFGFIEDQIVSLDVGGLIPDRPNLKTYFCDRELEKAKNKTIAWLKHNDRSLIEPLEKKVAALKAEIQ